MNINLYKNDIKQTIKKDNITFNKELKKIEILSEEYKIILDFINKKCHFNLIKENQSLDIEVLNMNHKSENKTEIFTYTLITEPNIVNKIKID